MFIKFKLHSLKVTNSRRTSRVLSQMSVNKIPRILASWSRQVQVDINYVGDLKSQARGIIIREGLSGDRLWLQRIDDSEERDTGVLVTVPPCTRGLMGSGLPGWDWLWSWDSRCWWRSLAGLGQLGEDKGKGIIRYTIRTHYYSEYLEAEVQVILSQSVPPNAAFDLMLSPLFQLNFVIPAITITFSLCCNHPVIPRPPSSAFWLC